LESILVNHDALPEISAVAEEASFVKQKRSAFVFINTQCDECQEAYEDLQKLDSVDEVYLSRGAYDIIAKVSGESFEFLREEVLKQIKNISSIKSTLTLTIV
jgi:DNA-binding Lrp family transcriptional regulator